MITPVILCGGSGTRLWPSSRQSLPKQFVRLLGEHTLFQSAVQLAAGPGFAAPVIVTGEPFRFIVKEQLEEAGQGAAAILIEPEPRNTAPAVLLAALHLAQTAPNALMLVLPSDQLVRDATAFRAAVSAAKDQAQAGAIITFGIEPTRPDTGFGYLELADPAARNAARPQPLRRFVEKPDAAAAAAMLATGSYLWNAGIFLFSVATIIRAFRTHAPDIFAAVSAVQAGAKDDQGFIRFDRSTWARSPGISVDYAIMEKAANLAVMPYGGGWADLGDWNRVWMESVHDTDGTVCTGPVTAIDCAGTLLRSETSGLHVVGFGLQDMLVVATGDAVLVAPQAAGPRVGEVVARLKQHDVAQAVVGTRDLRPWGWFESIARGERFQVKRILVKPGASMSLQSHQHRTEHWVIVAGTATVTVGEEVREFQVDQSVYIPVGARHRLENKTDSPVILIEVQTGAYLGEDDIVRYQDQYARSSPR
ncbi:MAG: mannose-1-phosphate guanylyltransferase/mannose-6-phosphate isomerase [Erythrobacter sp.]|nr:mannose-1-phosphate guanylyltransferase/mannose-6-phosphate isomerase [Erythrobacter sp.]